MEHLIAPYLTGSHADNVNRVVEKRWLGKCERKPWEYEVTATFAHLETPELVPYVIGCLRHQSVRPYIIIVDTGSSRQTLGELEKYRAEDVEIHHIRSHGYRHPSMPVSAACDLALTLTQTEYLFWTHVDCFLRNRDYLKMTRDLCDAATPVVGYEISPRDDQTTDWHGMVGHTATMTHKPSLDRLGVTWSVERAHHQFGVPRNSEMTGGWPDTESTLGYILRAAGIEPKLIGHDVNRQRQKDENIDHCRSFPGSKLYAADGEANYHHEAKGWIFDALTEAQERINQWQS
jgi:hypothetical protein